MKFLDRLRGRLAQWIVTGNVRSGFRYRNGTLASNETIFSAVSMLSGAMASLPVTLRQDAGRIPAQAHPVARLLEYGPHSDMTTFQFIRCMETLRDCTGAGYALKAPDAWGRPEALHLLRTECVSPVRDRETREVYYHIRDPDDGGDIYLHHSAVIAVSHISEDGLHPINPIDVLQNSLSYDREVKEFSVEQMQNGTRANLVVKWKNANLNRDQIAEYDRMVRSFKKAGILYVDSGKEVQQLQGSSVIDPKVFEVESITIARVARVYNLPLEKFLPDKSSYSSAEQADLNYLRDTILPMVRMYEQEFTKKLLGEQERAAGMYVKFSLNGFARADMETRGKFYTQAIRSGWMCQDEIRDLEDLPPIPDGKGRIFYTSKDLAPIGNPSCRTERGNEI